MPFTNDEDIVVNKSQLYFYSFLLSFIVFIASLFTNCFCTIIHCRTSIEALLMGWLTMLTGCASISWLANPFLFTSWFLLLKKKKTAWIFSLIATIFSLYFLNYNAIIENEAGTISPIIKLGIGYWLWLSSCVAALFGSLLIQSKNIKENNG